MKRQNIQRSTLNFQRPKARPLAALTPLNVERWKLDVERFPASPFVPFAPFRGKNPSP